MFFEPRSWQNMLTHFKLQIAELVKSVKYFLQPKLKIYISMFILISFNFLSIALDLNCWRITRKNCITIHEQVFSSHMRLGANAKKILRLVGPYITIKDCQHLKNKKVNYGLLFTPGFSFRQCNWHFKL